MNNSLIGIHIFEFNFGNSKKTATQSDTWHLTSRILQSQKSRLGNRLESPISSKFFIKTLFSKFPFLSGGAEGIRTLDPLLAKQML